MATETVPQGPQAFAVWDSTIYLAWIKAMGDMMLCRADPKGMGESTMQDYGGLMHALAEAAEELQAREEKAMLARVRAAQ